MGLRIDFSFLFTMRSDMAFLPIKGFTGHGAWATKERPTAKSADLPFHFLSLGFESEG